MFSRPCKPAPLRSFRNPGVHTTMLSKPRSFAVIRRQPTYPSEYTPPDCDTSLFWILLTAQCDGSFFPLRMPPTRFHTLFAPIFYPQYQLTIYTWAGRYPIIKDSQLPSWIYFFLYCSLFTRFSLPLRPPVSRNALSFLRFTFIKTRIGKKKKKIFFFFFFYLFVHFPPLYPCRALYRILKIKKNTQSLEGQLFIPYYYKTSFQFDRGSLFWNLRPSLVVKKKKTDGAGPFRLCRSMTYMK